jgi:hypothetical protein
MMKRKQASEPHENYRTWAERSIRGQAVADHLYTTTANDEEPDVFERFLKNEIEAPAIEVLEKAERADALSIEEHDRITRYVVALDQRTPASYLDHLVRTKAQAPGWLNSTLISTLAELERASARGRRPRPRRRFAESPEMITKLPLTVKVERTPNRPHGGYVRAELSPGREMWLWTIERALRNCAKARGWRTSVERRFSETGARMVHERPSIVARQLL